MVIDTYTTTPFYLFLKYPNDYENQQHYIDSSTTIVNEAATKFSRAIEEGSDLTELFYSTLEEMRQARYRLACELKDPKAELFGKRRDTERPPNVPAVGTYTHLYEPYDEYNKSLLEKIQKQLAKMKHTKREFIQTESIIKNKPCLGRASSLEFKIINPEINNKVLKFAEFENCVRISKLCGLAPPEINSDTIPFLNKLIHSESALRELKMNSAEDYQLLKVHKAIWEIYHLQRWKEWRKSDWVLVTVRLEIDNKMYALSQYLTWMNRDFEEDPVENMKDRSKITIIHHDEFLIDATLKDIAALFKKALMCDKENFTDLKDIMMLMSYEFAHNMPLGRGSAAVGEWIEHALYTSKGYQMKYAISKLLNLEAVTSTLPEFVENYSKLTRFEKLANL